MLSKSAGLVSRRALYLYFGSAAVLCSTVLPPDHGHDLPRILDVPACLALSLLVRSLLRFSISPRSVTGSGSIGSYAPCSGNVSIRDIPAEPSGRLRDRHCRRLPLCSERCSSWRGNSLAGHAALVAHRIGFDVRMRVPLAVLHTVC